MTFPMPIKSKYAQHDTRLSSSMSAPSRRSVQIGRAATLVAADCAAFMLSRGSAAMLTWQTDIRDIILESLFPHRPAHY
jgi:hypothetical protein